MAFLASGGGTGKEWKTAPNATNYIDMFEKVLALALAANEGVTVVGTIQDGGTGYAVGDFVRVADGAADVGGTAVHPGALSGATATFEVTDVSGGVVQAGGLRLRQSGCYSTNPANNGTSGEYDTVALTGIGDDALAVDLTFASPGWAASRVTQEIDTAVVGANGGLLYSVGDDLDIVGGDTRTGFDAPQSTNAGQVNVDTESGGVVTGISILDRGIYHRNPGTDEVATNAVTGGGDNDCTVDLTFRDFADTTTDREMILTSTDGFHIGIRTFSDGATINNWEIMGMQEFTPGSDWDAQTNQSVGRYPDNTTGSYFVLEDEAFPYQITITERYIVIECNIAVGIYSNIWIGAFDNYGTAAQYPTPLLVLGCSSIRSATQGTKDSQWGGMNACIANLDSNANGPGQVLSPGAGWLNVRNGHGNNTNGDIDFPTTYTHVSIIPGGDFSPIGTAFESQDEFIGDTSVSALRERWAYWCHSNDPDSPSGVGQNSNDRQFITMGNESGTEFPVLWELTLVDTLSPTPSLLGEIGGVRWVDKRIDGGSGFISSEDESDDGINYWYFFNNCRLDRDWSYFAMQGA